jgi:hypothetical protein
MKADQEYLDYLCKRIDDNVGKAYLICDKLDMLENRFLSLEQRFNALERDVKGLEEMEKVRWQIKNL